jgi:hypothetical protein
LRLGTTVLTTSQIASTLTYPFSLAKARSQISSKPPVDPSTVTYLKYQAENISSRTDAANTGRDASSAAKRSTVFSTILHIYRTEGPAALYEGVFGEILKGFFSHGITMIVKEQIHRLIIQTYYLLLRMVAKYPSPGELASQASGMVRDGAEKAGELAGQAGEMASDQATQASDFVRNGTAQAGEAIQNGAAQAGEVLKDGYNNASSRVGDMVESGWSMAETAGERIGVMASNGMEVAKTTEDLASKEAGHLLGNAQEMLGGKIPGVKSEDQ